MDYLEILFLILAGLGAGFVNTLAGNGSLFTLTILMEFIGLPALVANGTNRVGIAFHSVVASHSMWKQHGIEKSAGLNIIPLMFIGGVCGGLASVYVSAEQFRFVYRALLILLFFTLLINPKKWIDPTRLKAKIPNSIKSLIIFVVGVYGGFIQMGMGVIMLAVLVLIYKLPLMKANAIKLVSVLVYTPVVLAIFIMNDMVDWYYGLLIAVGQIIGGWITANYISKWKHANTLAYLLLIIMVSAALIKIFFFSN